MAAVSTAPCRGAGRCRWPSRRCPPTGPSGTTGGCCARRCSSSHTQLCSQALADSRRPRAPLARREALEQRLGRDHAGLHRRVRALDLGHVEEAGGVADQHAARESQLRESTGSRPRTARARRRRCAGRPRRWPRIAGWVLKRWNSSNGREVGIRVVEADDEADRDLVVLQVIEERAAIGVGVQRPADGVHDQRRAGAWPARPPTAP